MHHAPNLTAPSGSGGPARARLPFLSAAATEFFPAECAYLDASPQKRIEAFVVLTRRFRIGAVVLVLGGLVAGTAAVASVSDEEPTSAARAEGAGNSLTGTS